MKSRIAILILAALLPVRESACGGPAALELVFIDDSFDPLDPTVKLPKVKGAAIGREEGSWGGVTKCLKVPLGSGEKFSDVAKDLHSWAKSLNLPKGVRLGFGRLWDREGIKTLPFVRSYVLKGAPIVTSADLASAVAAVSDVYPWVQMTLTAAGGRRLKDAKRDHPRGRLAVIIDGEVRRASEVQYMDDGLGFSLGSGDFDRDMAEAKRLAQALKP